MWDENKCGSLQLAELRVALAKCVSEATAFNNKPDPAQEHIRKLQRRAQMADDAAQATEVADKAELALAEYRERLKTRADVRLGALLQKRMIKPGEVVVHWAKSKGEHAGELSKVQFRRAVLNRVPPGTLLPNSVIPRPRLRTFIPRPRIPRPRLRTFMPRPPRRTLGGIHCAMLLCACVCAVCETQMAVETRRHKPNTERTTTNNAPKRKHVNAKTTVKSAITFIKGAGTLYPIGLK